MATAKKTPAKKTTAKKTTAKKSTVKKTATKKSTAGKPAARKPAAKKTSGTIDLTGSVAYFVSKKSQKNLLERLLAIKCDAYPVDDLEGTDAREKAVAVNNLCFEDALYVARAFGQDGVKFVTFFSKNIVIEDYRFDKKSDDYRRLALRVAQVK